MLRQRSQWDLQVLKTSENQAIHLQGVLKYGLRLGNHARHCIQHFERASFSKAQYCAQLLGEKYSYKSTSTSGGQRKGTAESASRTCWAERKQYGDGTLAYKHLRASTKGFTYVLKRMFCCRTLLGVNEELPITALRVLLRRKSGAMIRWFCTPLHIDKSRGASCKHPRLISMWVILVHAFCWPGFPL